MTNFARCLAYLSNLPPAVSGSGGHSATLRAACECVRFGLTDGEAMQALAEYNRRCQPAWSERELAHKLASARRLAASESGTKGRPAPRPRGGARGFDLAALDRAMAARGITPRPRVGGSGTGSKPDGTALVARPPAAIAIPPGCPESIAEFAREVGAVVTEITTESTRP